MGEALLMNRKQAAEALNMSLSHFQRHLQDALPCVATGQLRLYRPIDLRRWIDAQLQSPFAIDGFAETGASEETGQFTIRFEMPHERFIKDCREGVALNNRREPYKPKAILSLDSALRRVPASICRKRLVDVAGYQLQEAIDSFIRDGLSASRIHGIVCAIRSLYTWAIHRGRAAQCPAANLRMPAIAQSSFTRVATPAEFADLLKAIDAEDALAWALAAYGTARRQEIEALDWKDVDFEHAAVLLAATNDARKSEAAHRVVPMVAQLRARLEAEWGSQGRPDQGVVFPPKRIDNSTGTADLNSVLRRVTKRWSGLGRDPITFQETRHTAATWLDHAGVSPKVASMLMGHKTPKPEIYPGAAPITLRRYTHVLGGELARAGKQLEVFLSRREVE